MIYGDTQYFYVKNAQGDVVQIRSKWGTTLVEYEYDAWGNCTIAYSHSSYGNLAELNPIRYRGYVYDFETGFYYLQSRYYDPQIRRFISADDLSMLGVGDEFLSYNLYAYCLNNPINTFDFDGHFARAIIGGAVSAVVTWLLYLVEYKLGMREWNWATLIGYIVLNTGFGALKAIAFGVPFSGLLKLTKYAGIAQKVGLTGIALNLLKLLATGTTFFINAVSKSFTRKPGETWFTALKRLFA